MLLSALFVLARFASTADYRSRFPFPDDRVSDGLGVCIHFTDPRPGEIRMMREAGFRWVRAELPWGQIEKRRGSYDFSAQDRLMAALKPAGIRTAFILAYGNDLYQKGAPTTDSARKAFADFASAAVRHFRHQGVLWEIWNEPNIDHFWRPHANVADYMALEHETAAAIRKVSPDEWIMGPAVSRFDWPFLRRCFSLGLLDDVDALSVHPYRNEAPESAALDFSQLMTLVQGSTSRPIHLVSGEWGFSTADPGMDEARQANYVVRQYLSNLSNGVSLSFLYDWSDDAGSRSARERAFGLVRENLTPKPAALQLEGLTKALSGYRFVRSLEGLPMGAHLLKFQSGTTMRYVAWAENEMVTGAPLPREFQPRMKGESDRRYRQVPVVLEPKRSGSP